MSYLNTVFEKIRHFTVSMGRPISLLSCVRGFWLRPAVCYVCCLERSEWNDCAGQCDWLWTVPVIRYAAAGTARRWLCWRSRCLHTRRTLPAHRSQGTTSRSHLDPSCVLHDVVFIDRLAPTTCPPWGTMGARRGEVRSLEKLLSVICSNIHAVFDRKPTYNHCRFSSQMSIYTEQKFRFGFSRGDRFDWGRAFLASPLEPCLSSFENT